MQDTHDYLCNVYEAYSNIPLPCLYLLLFTCDIFQAKSLSLVENMHALVYILASPIGSLSFFDKKYFIINVNLRNYYDSKYITSVFIAFIKL